MCGITGFVDFRRASDEKILNAMLAPLAHRGPDGHGIHFEQFTDFQLGLGHQRLAIIDLSDHGKQPMQHQDLNIVFNGEIYNFNEIKAELSQNGHRFTSDSDTEMILHAYEQWGENCLDRFIGMFAFVIFDRKHKRIFAARDRAGVKPFFYYWNDGLFLFSSELKSFHSHPAFHKEINPSALAAYLQYGNVPTPHCIFTHCSKLNPGTYLDFQLTDKVIVEHRYWSVYDSYNKPKTNIAYSEAKLKTKEILQSAFNYRMVSDVPVGVFLSGGYDSVAVAALIQSERTDKLKTFTVSVPDMGLNEAPFAKEIANHLGTDHTEIACTQKDALELIPLLPYHYDEPFGDSSAIPTMLVSKMARKHVTVALSADGGDEIFAGYNRYDYLMRHGKRINAMPAAVRKSVAGFMELIPSQRIPVLRNTYNFHNRYEKLKGILRDPSPQKIMKSLSTQFTEGQLEQLIQVDYTELETAYTSTALNPDFFTPLSYLMAIDYTTYMLDDILQKVDRATMSASLEGREPYMDQRIIEWAAQLPDDFKYHNGVKKYILKEIVHDYVPKTMMDRPKMGFAIPVGDWLQEDLRDLLESYLNESRIKQEGLLNWDYVRALKHNFLHGKKELDQKIWYLLMFEMWYERWMK